ncbi:MAG: DegV family protein [Pygmaiobacter sp.]|nr:DegV family protein [Pygmaiobacter sp.]
MVDFIIAAASTADLPAEYFTEHNVPVIHYTYILDNEPFDDDCQEKSRETLYKRMREGVAITTSMINAYTYYDFFKTLMDTGKDVIFLDMTRQISNSFTNAEKAAEQIKKEYQNQRFYLMDTLCVSGGLGMLLHYMVLLRDAGKSFDETIEWAEANKRRIIHWFTVDDLSYLKHSGRVSNTAAMVGDILSVKPVLYVSNDGKLVVASKVRGRRKALLDILEKMKKDFTEPDGKEVFINHADCFEDAEFMRDKVLQTFPTVSKITITSLGVVIGAHCGPGLFTIFYLGNKRYA